MNDNETVQDKANRRAYLLVCQRGQYQFREIEKVIQHEFPEADSNEAINYGMDLYEARGN